MSQDPMSFALSVNQWFYKHKVKARVTGAESNFDGEMTYTVLSYDPLEVINMREGKLIFKKITDLRYEMTVEVIRG